MSARQAWVQDKPLTGPGSAWSSFGLDVGEHGTQLTWMGHLVLGVQSGSWSALPERGRALAEELLLRSAPLRG